MGPVYSGNCVTDPVYSGNCVTGPVPHSKSGIFRGRLIEALGGWGSGNLEGRGGLGEGWSK